MKKIKIVLARAALCLCLVVLSALPAQAAELKPPAQAAELKKVLLLRPDGDHPFWALFEKAMKAACHDFGCDVTSRMAGWDRIVMLDQLEAALKSDQKPDMVYFQSFKKNGPDIIRMLEKYGVDGFLINAGLDEEQQKEIGKPREKYKHWIGQMLPDDYGAGRFDAELLYRRAKEKGLAGKDGKVLFSAIEGNIADGASIQRVRGLKDFLAEHGTDTALTQIVQGKWDAKVSKKMASMLMNRYPDAHVIWAAGDPVARGVMDAAEEAGKKPGKDILTAGVDWADYVLQAIRDGKIEGSAGGHFMEGGWAIVVTYDRMHGADFAKDGDPSLFSKMGLLTSENLARYTAKFGDEDFEKIDFKKLSKAANPALKEYDFNITALLD
jgi:ABC-type sugar transport system substrate-binding protein